MTPPLADKACRLAMVTTRPALGGEQLRATFPRTWEEVVAEEQPGTCPEACLRQSLQLAPRPRLAGWEVSWAVACFGLGSVEDRKRGVVKRGSARPV